MWSTTNGKFGRRVDKGNRIVKKDRWLSNIGCWVGLLIMIMIWLTLFGLAYYYSYKK